MVVCVRGCAGLARGQGEGKNERLAGACGRVGGRRCHGLVTITENDSAKLRARDQLAVQALLYNVFEFVRAAARRVQSGEARVQTVRLTADGPSEEWGGTVGPGDEALGVGGEQAGFCSKTGPGREQAAFCSKTGPGGEQAGLLTERQGSSGAKGSSGTEESCLLQAHTPGRAISVLKSQSLGAPKGQVGVNVPVHTRRMPLAEAHPAQTHTAVHAPAKPLTHPAHPAPTRGPAPAPQPARHLHHLYGALDVRCIKVNEVHAAAKVGQAHSERLVAHTRVAVLGRRDLLPTWEACARAQPLLTASRGRAGQGLVQSCSRCSNVAAHPGAEHTRTPDWGAKQLVRNNTITTTRRRKRHASHVLLRAP